MIKNSFVMHGEYAEQLSLLNMTQRGELFTALLDYANGTETHIDDGMVVMAFAFIKARIDAEDAKYAEVCLKRKAAGQMGGRPKQTEAKESKEKQKNQKVSERFIPPTVAEVEAYCKEHGYKVNANQFVGFYESKGWMVGKNKMKDWKAAIRGTWANKEVKTTGAKKNAFHNFEERNYSSEFFESLVNKC